MYRSRLLRAVPFRPLRREASICSEEVCSLARRAGASASEAAILKSIFDLEGFDEREFDLRFSALETVARELTRLRTLAAGTGLASSRLRTMPLSA